MTEDLMRYDMLVESALRAVVKNAVLRAADEGLPGEHHFYITFRTTEPGVVIADFLREKYPSEMTIVLQHQYRDLAVDDEGFSISLSFNDISENLRIPFAAIAAFADPTVNFGLQFKVGDDIAADDDADTDADVAPPADTAETDPGQDAQNDSEAGADGNVVTLDQFRRK